MGRGPVKYVLDTHVWIWWHMQPKRLSSKVKKAIADSAVDALLLSAISTWEFCKLIEKGKLGISCDPEVWMREALDMPRLRLVPITPRIAYCSTALPSPFHSDPADQIIAATAREENAVLLTRDKLMHEYAHVRTMW